MPRASLPNGSPGPVPGATRTRLATRTARWQLAGVNATTYEFIMAANSTIGLKPGVPTASGMLIVEAEDFGGQQGTCRYVRRRGLHLSFPRWNSTPASPSPPARPSGPSPERSPAAPFSYSTDGSGGSQ